MSDRVSTSDRLRQRRFWPFIAGGVFALIWLIAAFFQTDAAWQAYLLALVFFVGPGIGALAFLLMHHLTGGAWGVAARPGLLAAAETLPLMAVLFLPLLFVLDNLYAWANPDLVEQSHLLEHKAAYLNTPFFVGRSIVYFGTWIGGVMFMRSRPREDRLHLQPPRLRGLAAVLLALLALTVTFAAIDWIMSLEAEWYSTIFGVVILVGDALFALALAVVTLGVLARGRHRVTPPASAAHDLGNLLLVCVMMWAYVSFSQFLIIWSGNIVEEILWLVPRAQGWWKPLGITLMIAHFAIPFLALLSATLKRDLTLLSATAAFLIFVHLLDTYWIVVPSFKREGVQVHWLDFVALLAIGGLWLGTFLWRLTAHEAEIIEMADVLPAGGAHHA